MNAQTNLWLIRHAPVDGPRGVIYGPDAPADLGDATAFAALKARLPGAHLRCAVRRAARGRRPSDWVSSRSNRPPFANRILARGPDGVTTNSNANSARPIANSGNHPQATGRPAAKVLSTRSRARALGLRLLPAGEAILVVHSGTIRAVLAIALDLAPEQALRFVIDPLSLTRIDRLEEGWRVVAVNTR